MLVYTFKMGTEKNFIPDNPAWIDNYLLLLGLFVVPKGIFTLCSLIGLGYCRIFKKHHNWGNLVGLFLSIMVIYILVYGSTFGLRQLKINRIDIAFKDLPPAFDGYRIVHWSDAHVGTYMKSRRPLLERAVDSIRKQQADMVVFTGDLQNLQPSELYPFQDLFRSIHAKDGVFSVLGNHDYSGYIAASNAIKVGNERELISRQRQYGWQLLLNEHQTIHRGADSIVIAGTENDGLPPYPAKGNVHQALRGVGDNAFVVMLQHDPSAWRRIILPQSHAQLTLSGHTHGGQLSLFGIRISQLLLKEDYGLYRDGSRALYVTSGFGGLIPFRFGVSSEIAVITLHRQK
ncbi:metallophosphoesterase [Hoylesella timonensis 4401737 = DSM 22865 = JCM 15640]